tara:strand:- start:1137 stop:1601 length:465 start_codon:yes stop_codon:yes gene_type:complete
MNKRKYDNLPFEFYLRINGNERPIVGRNFGIKGYNSQSLRSMEMKECIDDCVSVIEKQFKAKSEDYSYKYYNSYEKQNEADIDRRNVFDNEDIFTFEIRAFGRTVATKMFSGNWYPPKVRYDVDIRKLIPSIISTIQETLSEENLSKEYAGIAL